VTTLASHLSTFLREYLPRDRAASTHTCEAYAYSLMLLLRFASERLRVTPSQINLAQVDSPLVLAFLTDIEKAAAIRANPQCPLARSSRSFATSNIVSPPYRAGRQITAFREEDG